MTRTRLSLYAMIAAIIAVVVLSWVLGVAPQLQQASVNDHDRRAVDHLNQVQTAKLEALSVDRGDVTALKAQLAKADAALPSTPDLSGLLGELDRLQSRYGVQVAGYTPGVPQAFGSAATTSAGSAPVASATPAPSAAAAPASSGTAATLTPAASIGPTGLYAIPVQVQATGSYSKLTDFVGALQSGPRLFVVNKLTIAKDDVGGDFIASVGGFVYVLQSSAGAAAR